MRLTMKQQYKLNKDFKGIDRVVIFTGPNEQTLDFIPLLEIEVMPEKTLGQLLNDFSISLLNISKENEALVERNKALMETIEQLKHLGGN